MRFRARTRAWDLAAAIAAAPLAAASAPAERQHSSDAGRKDEMLSLLALIIDGDGCGPLAAVSPAAERPTGSGGPQTGRGGCGR